MLFDMFMQYGKYRADKAQAKADRAMQEYKNKMVNIADAMNQNSITTNTTKTIQQSARQAVHLRRNEIGVLGSTASAAAAAGVRGRSVNATIIDAKRNAGFAEGARVRDLEGAQDQFTQQRIGSRLSAIQNQDLTHIPKPRFSTYMFSAVASNIDKVAGMFGGQTNYGQQADAIKQSTNGRTAGSAGYAGSY